MLIKFAQCRSACLTLTSLFIGFARHSYLLTLLLSQQLLQQDVFALRLAQLFIFRTNRVSLLWLSDLSGSSLYFTSPSTCVDTPLFCLSSLVPPWSINCWCVPFVTSPPGPLLTFPFLIVLLLYQDALTRGIFDLGLSLVRSLSSLAFLFHQF
jgi:hypothetical protein